MKIMTIVGARPQFIKAAAVSHALARHPGGAEEVLVHTGQHPDDEMSRVFFEELRLPPPKHHLGVSGGSHADMTGRMLAALEPVMIQERPDRVVIYGDTNSTLAGALAAAKLNLPIAHVEAGLRSFNRLMPEETNRLVADRLSRLLFCPTAAAVANLAREGITSGVHHVGDVMYDSVLHYGAAAEASSRILDALGLAPGAYYLATVHRAENTDDRARLAGILEALAGASLPVVLPLHPRTRQALGADLEKVQARVRVIGPAGYLDMLMLERCARLILTDSGGVQKEAYGFGVPCVTLRGETEWVELVAAGWNRLAGADPDAIGAAMAAAEAMDRSIPRPPFYGDGRAAERIVSLLLTPA